MPQAIAMGTPVEQSGEFLPCASRARRCPTQDLADSLHRLPEAARNLRVLVPRRNRPVLLQREFRISLWIPRLALRAVRRMRAARVIPRRADLAGKAHRLTAHNRIPSGK